jgi:trehalose synthase
VIEQIDIESHLSLDDYGAYASLSARVQSLRRAAGLAEPSLRGRTVWMMSSTAAGGGVAEMMPRVIALLRELGVHTEWLVMRPRDARFFAFTKRLHNLVHGHGQDPIRRGDRELYERVSGECAAQVRRLVARDDIIVVHDPQPLGIGADLARDPGVRLVWRCHIGTDEHNAATDAAWHFLRRYATACDRALFSAPEYIRDFLAGRAAIMHPSIDPLTHKNRDLAPSKLVGILCNASLLTAPQPILTPRFRAPALRLQPDGTFAPATTHGDIGLPYRPIITQVSRWDRLKGFAPLLRAFVRLKELRPTSDRRRQRRREIVRLVLAGPSPESVSDDPEAADTIAELAAQYLRLSPSLQADVALVTLPMTSLKHNGLMVNCLQRCSAIVVQNSLAEGFGLTATEAMWKSVPVLASSACGLRQQVRDGLDGRVIEDGTDADALAELMDDMLADGKRRQAWGRSGQKRAYDEFLIFRQIHDWLDILSSVVRPSARTTTQHLPMRAH